MVVTLIMIVSIVILIHGLGLNATGVADKTLGKGPRIANIVLGILAVVVSASINAIPGLALAMMLLLVSIGLLFHGIARSSQELLDRDYQLENLKHDDVLTFIHENVATNSYTIT